MKRLSLQWRITLMSVLLIGITCTIWTPLQTAYRAAAR